MAITPDNTARADDFIDSDERDATPSNDTGRVPKLEGSNAIIHPQQLGMTGTVKPFAGASADIPDFWLLCDGSAVSRTTYDKLFDAIGVLWGSGDGSTTFNIPDLRGRTLVGADGSNIRLGADGTVTNLASVGDAGGSEVHQLTQSELASHNHGADYSVADTSGGILASTGDIALRGAVNNYDNAYDRKNSLGIDDAGSDQTHQNMPPYGVINWIIGT